MATSHSTLPVDHRASRSVLMPLLAILFIGSGCAALIYEIVWLQMLQLLIGSTTISLGVLLAVFMGGMCLGSLLLPRFVSPRLHPLYVYAILEIGIALCSVIFLWAQPWIEQLYVSMQQGNQGLAQRALVAAICLLPPTILMGATLPAIARWVESTREGYSWLGFFYGSNIFGAVGGCLLAGFYLLRVLDMPTSTYVAAAINIAVSAMAVALAWFSSHSAVETTAGTDTPSATKATRSSSTTLVLIALAVSGCCALAAEITWTRLLSLLMGGTVYTFSIILATYLIGLGIGSTAGSVLSRTVKSPLVALAWTQVLVLLAIAWAGALVTRSLPHWPIDPSISPSIWFTFQLDLARSACVILPAACLWGASFPIALSALTTVSSDAGSTVGRLYAANTLGAIVGALAFSVWVIPSLGTLNAQLGLLILTWAGVLVCVTAIWVQQGSPSTDSAADKASPIKHRAAKPLALAIAILATCFSVAAGWTLREIPWSVIAYGRYAATWERILEPGIVASEAVADFPGSASEFCIMTGEGRNVSVAVTQERSGVKKFHGGGKVQASSSYEDMRLQRMLGHIPALVHEDPQDVLVIACGAGVTAGSFLPHPEVNKVVICDIEPLVPTRVTPHFAEQNFDVVGPANADRVDIHFDDGRHFIRTTEMKFDIITSDPIDPWVKGCASLNTVEYYQMCRERLKPGGIMALWMPLYESDAETLKSVIATFYEVFPNGVLWTNDYEKEGYDAVLFGQVEGTQIDLQAVQERLKDPNQARVVQSLKDIGFESIEELFATYAGDAASMREWSAGAQLNTDQNLRLQYLAGLSLNSYISAGLLDGILEHYEYPEELFQGTTIQIATLKYHLRNAGRPE